MQGLQDDFLMSVATYHQVESQNDFQAIKKFAAMTDMTTRMWLEFNCNGDACERSSEKRSQDKDAHDGGPSTKRDDKGHAKGQ